MANVLKARITLEGGRQIEVDLEKLGATGQRAFKKIADAAKEQDGPLSRVSKTIGGLRSAVGVAASALTTVATSIATAGVAIVGTATAAGSAILAVARSSATAADEMGKAAKRAGINAREYQRLAFAAKEADVEQGAFETGLKTLNKQLAEAQINGRSQLNIAKLIDPRTGRVLRDVSVNLRNARGQYLTTEQVLLRVADVFQTLPEGAIRSTAAVELFGKAGAAFVPFLDQGAAAIKSAGDEAVRLGLVFSDSAIAASDQFNDTLDRLGFSVKGVAYSVGQVFIPELTNLAKLLTDFVVRNRQQIVDWVVQGWLFLKQIVLDIVAIFQGRDAEVVNTWLITARDNFNKAIEVADRLGGALMRILELFGLIDQKEVKPVITMRADGQSNFVPSLPAFASGGHTGRGPSSGFLATLHPNEYVINASRVSQFGRGFFDAINFGGQIPAFETGGLAEGPSGRPVNLNIGGQSFAGSMSDDVVDRMVRVARRAQLLSPTKAPSWRGRK